MAGQPSLLAPAVLHAKQSVFQLRGVPPAYGEVLPGHAHDRLTSRPGAYFDDMAQRHEIAAVDPDEAVVGPALLEESEWQPNQVRTTLNGV